MAAAGSPPPMQSQQPGDAGKKKKRGYATQAYEFGAGGNAAAGAPVAGGMMPGQPGHGASPMGYPAQQDFQAGYGGAPAPAYGASPTAVGYGVPPVGTPAQPGVGGYQAPDAYYQGAAVPGTPQGMGGITAGMQNMNMGGQSAPAQPAQQQARVALNQLYPTDLLNQPFNVSELDLPPPPCILPPNVSLTARLLLGWYANMKCVPGQRHSIPRCQLPPEVHSIYPECRPHNAFSLEEVEASFRPRHSTLRRAP